MYLERIVQHERSSIGVVMTLQQTALLPRQDVPSDAVTSGERPGPTVAVRTEVTVPLRFADGYATSARVWTFTGLADGQEHLALGLGDWQGALRRASAGGQPPLVRPHSECLTGDVFGSERCDCGPQLREAVERIGADGGVLVYLRQEGRGNGRYSKPHTFSLQDHRLETNQADPGRGPAAEER